VIPPEQNVGTLTGQHERAFCSGGIGILA